MSIICSFDRLNSPFYSFNACTLDLILYLHSFFLQKGNRFAMPLSRIALQSPAGAARGQV